jgi:hypothetical protein
MRRPVGVTLTGLGAFLLVLALMSHFVLPVLIIKFPLNEYSVSRLSGQGVSYLNPATGTVVNGRTVRAVATTQGDVSVGTSTTAVWNNITGVFDVTSGGSPGTAISYSTETFAFDRRTGVLMNCCGAQVGTKRVHLSGQGFVWPIGTQKKDYQVFDTTLLRPVTAKWTGTSTVNGLAVYVFVVQINNQQYGSVTLPGSLVGQTQATVTLPEYLTATNTYYVEPATGSPVKVVQQQSEALKDPTTGNTALVLFNGTLTSTPPSIAAAVHTASTSDTEISGVQDIGPLVAGLVGLFLLVLGILMLAGDNRDEYEYEEEDDESVAAQA